MKAPRHGASILSGAEHAAQAVEGILAVLELDELAADLAAIGLDRPVATYVGPGLHARDQPARARDLAACRDLRDGLVLARQRAHRASSRLRPEVSQSQLEHVDGVGQRWDPLPRHPRAHADGDRVGHAAADRSPRSLAEDTTWP